MTCSSCHSLLALLSMLVGNQRKHREQWRRKPWRRRDWAVAVLLEPLELHLQPPHLLLQRGVLQDYLQDLLREFVLHVLHHVRSRHTRLQSGTFAFFFTDGPYAVHSLFSTRPSMGMHCEPGYQKAGTQMLYGKKYNRCVKCKNTKHHTGTRKK